MPRTLTEKTDYLRWTFFAAGPVEQAIIAHSFKWDRNLTPQQRGRTGFGSYENVVETLAGYLAGRAFVCGDRFTAADVYVGSQVEWGLMFKTLPERPEFLAYSARLRERPAYTAAKAIDAKHIAEMKAAQ